MSRLVQAKAALFAGAVLVTAGVFGLAGWEVAALVAGAGVIAYGLFLVDVDERPERGGR